MDEDGDEEDAFDAAEDFVLEPGGRPRGRRGGVAGSGRVWSMA